MLSIHVNASKNVNKETPFDGDHGYIENKINYRWMESQELLKLFIYSVEIENADLKDKFLF